MTAGKDNALDDTIVNGQPGHAVLHSEIAAQVNWTTEQVAAVIDGDAGDLADALSASIDDAIDAAGVAVKATAQTFTEAQTVAPPNTAAHALKITSPVFASNTKFGVYIEDMTAGNSNNGRLLEIDHKGGGSQAYAVDIHNHQGATSGFVLHQYSGLDSAIQIDNCADEPMFTLRNTQNYTLAAGTQGTGHYFDLFGDVGTVGAVDVQRFGLLDKDLNFYAYQATKPWTFKTAAGVAAPAAKFVQTEAAYGIEIAKSGADTTKAAVRVSQGAPAPGIQVDQTGAQNGIYIVQSGAKSALNLNIQAGAAGFYAIQLDGQDYGPHFKTTTNSGDALTVTKNATGAGRGVVINNKGTGVSLEIQENGTAAFTFTAAGLPRWARAAAVQTTVGSAGAASALPATPSKYLKIVADDGTTYVVPAYAAS